MPRGCSHSVPRAGVLLGTVSRASSYVSCQCWDRFPRLTKEIMPLRRITLFPHTQQAQVHAPMPGGRARPTPERRVPSGVVWAQRRAARRDSKVLSSVKRGAGSASFRHLPPPAMKGCSARPVGSSPERAVGTAPCHGTPALTGQEAHGRRRETPPLGLRSLGPRTQKPPTSAPAALAASGHLRRGSSHRKHAEIHPVPHHSTAALPDTRACPPRPRCAEASWASGDPVFTGEALFLILSFLGASERVS